MAFICINGIFSAADQPALLADNKSYRYGDGFYETIRIYNGSIPLIAFHRERIVRSLDLLNYVIPKNFSIDLLFETIIELAAMNQCIESSRIRLSFSNGSGGLFDQSSFQYLIESVKQETPAFNANQRVRLGVYDEIKKDLNKYSGIKSASSLIYSQSARYALVNEWDECVILNSQGRVAETSISNLFWVKDGTIFTPSTEEGCVQGVLRAYLLQNVYGSIEKECFVEELEDADELFLTNAIRGIRPVLSFSGKQYSTVFSEKLFYNFIKPLFTEES